MGKQLKFYSIGEIERLPKPVLVSKYLSDAGILYCVGNLVFLYLSEIKNPPNSALLALQGRFGRNR